MLRSEIVLRSISLIARLKTIRDINTIMDGDSSDDSDSDLVFLGLCAASSKEGSNQASAAVATRIGADGTSRTDGAGVVDSSEVDAATEKVKKESLKKKKKAAEESVRQRTLQLTLQNLGAFEAMRKESFDGDDEGEDGEQSALTFEELTKRFKEGEQCFAASDFDGAVEAWKRMAESFASCEDTPDASKTLSIGVAACSGLGYAYDELGESRLAIHALLKALGAACSPQAQSSEASAHTFVQLQIRILTKLAEVYLDIGKDGAAQKCKESARLLQGNDEDGSSPEEGTSRGGRLPRSVVKAMDEAIEFGVSGDYGMLRALIVAYRFGRGSVTLSQLVNHKHSSTSATALMVAAGFGAIEIVDALLNSGANPNIEIPADDEGKADTALNWAARFGRANVMALLLSKGGEYGKGLTPQDVRSWPQSAQSFMLHHLKTAKEAETAAASKE